MFTDLATIRNAVKDRLTPILPAYWKPMVTLEGTIKARTPVYYIEYVALEQRAQNHNLPHGQVCARFNIIITDPKTDTEKAENSVDEHVLHVIRALDSIDDMWWDTCEKKRLEDGPLAWTFTVFAFATTTDTQE